MQAFMHLRGHAPSGARASQASSPVANPSARRHSALPPPPLRGRLRDTPSIAATSSSSGAQSPTELQAFDDADAVRQRLLAVRKPGSASGAAPPRRRAANGSRPDLHGPAGDLASRLAGAGPGGLASVGGGLLAPTLQQQTRIERAAEAGKATAGAAASPPPPPWETPDERAAREREAAERGDFGLPPGADVAEVEADESARDPRALLEALSLLAGARHHSPPNRRMLLPLLRFAGPRLLSTDGGTPLSPSSAAESLLRPPEPLSSRELVDLAHAMARIGPSAAPTRRFLAQLLLALRARGFWAEGEGEERDDGDDDDNTLARLSWALPQLAAWADDEDDASTGPSPTPDERALWHLLIGRTLADEETLPWLEREQRRRRRREAGASGGANAAEPLPQGCVVSAQLTACANLVRRRGPGNTPARDLANMLALPVSLAQQLEVAAAEQAPAPAAGGENDGDDNTNNNPSAFYSAAAEAVRAAALPLAHAALDSLKPASSLSPLPLTVPFEAAALLGALAALGARPSSTWVRAAATAALDEDFMLPLYELGELADVSRALLAFVSRLEQGQEDSIPPEERQAWARLLQRAILAAGAAAAAQAAEAGDRRADLAASRVQRAAREAAEALEALV